MRITRTGLAAALVTMTAGLALTVGTAGQAAASEHSSTSVVQNEVPWTGPVAGLLGLLGDVVDGITGGEVPWT
ncbi:hypothetical protein [Streptomyces sp. NBC_01104]|uniref:hypothetical protein n=1 Tax=Streptomyces sp. NBC_01104 TaxID=2903750 RepID=UPI0038704056|nr:hypothetical protein OG450_13965 [Streptomyces sp. NBC_01104]